MSVLKSPAHALRPAVLAQAQHCGAGPQGPLPPQGLAGPFVRRLLAALPFMPPHADNGGGRTVLC